MRNATERLGTASTHGNRHARMEQPVPTLQRSSRHRFHDDGEEVSAEDSRHAERNIAHDLDEEDGPR
jgi:hypothetical protein